MADADHRFIRAAIGEAKKSEYSEGAFCVGAVLTTPIAAGGAAIIATGYSRELPGNTHAEQCALEKCPSGVDLSTCTMYTTMEPCTTRLSGNVPCTKRLISAGIRRVVMAVAEPDDFVNCTGKQDLQAAGIDVAVVPGTPEAPLILGLGRTMAHLPQRSELPKGLECTVHAPPEGEQLTNILLLLHGLGDSNLPFSRLGMNLRLPETASMAIRAPHRLPIDLGDESEAGNWIWYRELMLDSASGQMSDSDGDFTEAVRLLLQLINDTLLNKCRFGAGNIYLFGYGQGGVVALETARQFAATRRDAAALGGVISIGGILPVTAQLGAAAKIPTPVLVCTGKRQASRVTDSEITRIRNVFSAVQVVAWQDKAEDSMPRGRKEWAHIMQWWSEHLKSQAGIPRDFVPVQ